MPEMTKDNLLIKILLGAILGLSLVFFKGTVLMLSITVLIGVALWRFLPKADREFLLKLFIWGMLLRIIIFGSIYLLAEEIPGRGELTLDSRLYTFKAVNLARICLGYQQLPARAETGVGENLYVKVLALFYLLIGHIPPAAIVDLPNALTYSLFSDKLINCLIGTLTGVVIFYIAREIFNKKVAQLASALVVFFPSLLFWSMTNVRDPANILLITLVILSVIKIQRKPKVKYFILLVGSLSIILVIRGYLFFPLLLVSIFSLLISGLAKCRHRILFAFLAIILALTFFNYTGYGRMLRNRFFDFDSQAKELYIANIAVISQIQGASYYRIYDDDFLGGERVSKKKFIKTLFKGWFHFMLTPFPWAISTIRQVVAYPQMLIWYLVLPFAFLGIFFALRYRLSISLSLICYILLMTSLFALVEGNFGSALRHRDLLVPFYLIFSAAGLLAVFGGINPFEKTN